MISSFGRRYCARINAPAVRVISPPQTACGLQIGGTISTSRRNQSCNSRPIAINRHSAAFILGRTVHRAGAGAWIGLDRVPVDPLIAIGLWWNANTIAHNFIHRPFSGPKIERDFLGHGKSGAGIPQRLWRDRHLAHHGGRPWRWRWSRQLAWEAGLVLALVAGCWRARRSFS